jgi:hypothetical protein
MQLFFDERDASVHARVRSHIPRWLHDLAAKPIRAAKPDDPGFVFAVARPLDDYRRLVGRLPHLRDRPEDRAPLLRLDSTLDALAAAGVTVPTPRTWRLPLDAPLPDRLTFPLFVRTAHSSLKRGGRVSKVRNRRELEVEAAELRRVLGWDALVLAREWHRLAEAGRGMYGEVPQEVRVWVVDRAPVAWSFHHLAIVPKPKGLPPSGNELSRLSEMAGRVASAFRSRCLVADFAREVAGDWLFIEAGPGSCAGTAHEGVFKAVAARLRGDVVACPSDAAGGLL